MAGASDKARFFLEQSVPELQEFERKKIFTKVMLIGAYESSNAHVPHSRRLHPLQGNDPTSSTRLTLEARILPTMRAMQSLR